MPQTKCRSVIVKGRINSIGSLPTVTIARRGFLRIDWEDAPEAWLEISLVDAMQLDIEGGEEEQEEQEEQEEPGSAEPAYADFGSTGDPKYSPTSYGAYADWVVSGDDSAPMPPMEAFGPEMKRD